MFKGYFSVDLEAKKGDFAKQGLSRKSGRLYSGSGGACAAIKSHGQKLNFSTGSPLVR